LGYPAGQDINAGKSIVEARGELACELSEERVNISGKAVLYMTAEIEI
jgi:hypothetical protein